jgi:hypothetical protein
MEEDLVMRIPVILTLDALQVLSRSQVTWVVNVHADTADM